MSDDPETARQIEELASDDRPLLILDVDDVVQAGGPADDGRYRLDDTEDDACAQGFAPGRFAQRSAFADSSGESIRRHGECKNDRGGNVHFGSSKQGRFKTPRRTNPPAKAASVHRWSRQPFGCSRHVPQGANRVC
ncbi:MAG: hypothetical protein J0I86_17370 [Mesorhizobium sp.]|nr:hypothetical protein [Mesorhizobium sp.]